MDEVYWGAFEQAANGIMRALGEEAVLPPAEAPLLEGGGWIGCGSGWSTYDTVLSGRYAGRLDGIDAQRLPNAIDVATLAVTEFRAGHAVSAEQALPVYLRDKVAEKKKR